MGAYTFTATAGDARLWTRVAKEHRLGWVTVAGMLLGGVRNQDITPFDDDIDLGLLIDEYPTLACLSRQELATVRALG